MNTHLLSVIDLDTRNEEMEALGLEGYNDIITYISDRYEAVRNMISLSGDAFTEMPKAIKSNLFGKDLKKAKVSDVGWINVYMPMGFKGHIKPYAVHIKDTLEKLADLETRLYEPLYKYVTGQIAEVVEVDAIWIDKNLKTVDTDKIKKAYKEFFNPKAKGNNTVSSNRFDKLYLSVGDFIKTGDVLNDIEKVIKSIDLSKLIELDEKLADALDKYRRLIVNGELEVTHNKVNVKRLVTTVDAIAEESALLSSYYYQFIALHTAYKDSLDKIKSNL